MEIKIYYFFNLGNKYETKIMVIQDWPLSLFLIQPTTDVLRQKQKLPNKVVMTLMQKKSMKFHVK